METPHWTAYLQALLTPVIALFAVYVSASQWTTARNKLRFDLFEKRYAVYEAARNFVGSIVTSGKVKEDNMYAYLIATKAAKWVVAREVEEYLEREIYKPALELQGLEAELDGVPVGDVRTNNVRRQREIKQHLNAQFEQIDRWFSAYLQLSH